MEGEPLVACSDCRSYSDRNDWHTKVCTECKLCWRCLTERGRIDDCLESKHTFDWLTKMPIETEEAPKTFSERLENMKVIWPAGWRGVPSVAESLEEIQARQQVESLAQSVEAIKQLQQSRNEGGGMANEY